MSEPPALARLVAGDRRAIAQAISTIENDAGDDDDLARAANAPRVNVFEHVVVAADAGCTHGEICATLRRELGFGDVQAMV